MSCYQFSTYWCCCLYVVFAKLLLACHWKIKIPFLTEGDLFTPCNSSSTIISRGKPQQLLAELFSSYTVMSQEVLPTLPGEKKGFSENETTA